MNLKEQLLKLKKQKLTTEINDVFVYFDDESINHDEETLLYLMDEDESSDIYFSQKALKFHRPQLTMPEEQLFNRQFERYLRTLVQAAERPGFALKLDFLVRRYRIHTYNLEQLIFILLPYKAYGAQLNKMLHYYADQDRFYYKLLNMKSYSIDFIAGFCYSSIEFFDFFLGYLEFLTTQAVRDFFLVVMNRIIANETTYRAGIYERIMSATLHLKEKGHVNSLNATMLASRLKQADYAKLGIAAPASDVEDTKPEQATRYRDIDDFVECWKFLEDESSNTLRDVAQMVKEKTPGLSYCDIEPFIAILNSLDQVFEYFCVAGDHGVLLENLETFSTDVIRKYSGHFTKNDIFGCKDDPSYFRLMGTLTLMFRRKWFKELVGNALKRDMFVEEVFVNCGDQASIEQLVLEHKDDSASINRIMDICLAQGLNVSAFMLNNMIISHKVLEVVIRHPGCMKLPFLNSLFEVYGSLFSNNDVRNATIALLIASLKHQGLLEFVDVQIRQLISEGFANEGMIELMQNPLVVPDTKYAYLKATGYSRKYFGVIYSIILNQCDNKSVLRDFIGEVGGATAPELVEYVLLRDRLTKIFLDRDTFTIHCPFILNSLIRLDGFNMKQFVQYALEYYEVSDAMHGAIFRHRAAFKTLIEFILLEELRETADQLLRMFMGMHLDLADHFLRYLVANDLVFSADIFLFIYELKPDFVFNIDFIFKDAENIERKTYFVSTIVKNKSTTLLPYIPRLMKAGIYNEYILEHFINEYGGIMNAYIKEIIPFEPLLSHCFYTLDCNRIISEIGQNPGVENAGAILKNVVGQNGNSAFVRDYLIAHAELLGLEESLGIELVKACARYKVPLKEIRGIVDDLKDELFSGAMEVTLSYFREYLPMYLAEYLDSCQDRLGILHSFFLIPGEKGAIDYSQVLKAAFANKDYRLLYAIVAHAGDKDIVVELNSMVLEEIYTDTVSTLALLGDFFVNIKDYVVCIQALGPYIVTFLSSQDKDIVKHTKSLISIVEKVTSQPIESLIDT